MYPIEHYLRGEKPNAISSSDLDVYISSQRRSGNTSRMADAIIDALYEGKKVFVRDHALKGVDRNANSRLLEMVKGKLIDDPRTGKFFMIKVDAAKLSIELEFVQAYRAEPFNWDRHFLSMEPSGILSRHSWSSGFDQYMDAPVKEKPVPVKEKKPHTEITSLGSTPLELLKLHYKV